MSETPMTPVQIVNARDLMTAFVSGVCCCAFGGVTRRNHSGMAGGGAAFAESSDRPTSRYTVDGSCVAYVPTTIRRSAAIAPTPTSQLTPRVNGRPRFRAMSHPMQTAVTATSETPKLTSADPIAAAAPPIPATMRGPVGESSVAVGVSLEPVTTQPHMEMSSRGTLATRDLMCGPDGWSRVTHGRSLADARDDKGADFCHGPGPIPRHRKKSFIDANGTPLAIRENTPLSRVSVAAS